MGWVRCRRRSSVVGICSLRKSATIELYLAGCDDELVKVVTGRSGVEMLKNMVGRSQREPAKRAQEARNQMERSKTET